MTGITACIVCRNEADRIRPCLESVQWVDEILVVEHARRRGVGRALMAEFETWAENGRCRMIGLATRAAASFYEELGFEDSAGYYKRYLRPEDRLHTEL